MDAKITLSFDKDVIHGAKLFADRNNISLSRLTEYIYRNLIENNYKSLDELPIANWVMQVAEEAPIYVRSRKPNSALKTEFYESRKKKK
jgi:hypothetical protein